MRYLLFTTTTCPKCPEFKEFVKTLNLKGRTVDENGTNFKAQLKKFGVTTVPTLVVFDRGIVLFRTSEIPLGNSVCFGGRKVGNDVPTSVFGTNILSSCPTGARDVAIGFSAL